MKKIELILIGLTAIIEAISTIAQIIMWLSDQNQKE